MWFISGRRHRKELAAVHAEAERDRAQHVRGQAVLDAANRRLWDRNLELNRRISALSESDPEYAAQLERKVAELQQRLDAAAREPADGEWRGRARRAEKDVERLRKELDNACGMPPGGLLDSAPWQPGYVAPKPDTKADAS